MISDVDDDGSGTIGYEAGRAPASDVKRNQKKTPA